MTVVDFYDFYVLLILVDLISVGCWSFCIIAVIYEYTLGNYVKDFREKTTIIPRLGDVKNDSGINIRRLNLN